LQGEITGPGHELSMGGKGGEGSRVAAGSQLQQSGQMVVVVPSLSWGRLEGSMLGI
jgi:hypothetical protein